MKNTSFAWVALLIIIWPLSWSCKQGNGPGTRMIDGVEARLDSLENKLNSVDKEKLARINDETVLKFKEFEKKYTLKQAPDSLLSLLAAYIGSKRPVSSYFRDYERHSKNILKMREKLSALRSGNTGKKMAGTDFKKELELIEISLSDLNQMINNNLAQMQESLRKFDSLTPLIDRVLK